MLRLHALGEPASRKGPQRLPLLRGGVAVLVGHAYATNPAKGLVEDVTPKTVPPEVGGIAGEQDDLFVARIGPSIAVLIARGNG